MRLVLRNICKLMGCLVSLFIIAPINVFAGWTGPQEIIQGSWGSGQTQFGITYQDTEDFIPIFDLTSDQRIVIRDGTNSRVKVYASTGILELIIPYKANLDYRDRTIADKFGFSGDFVGYGEGGSNYFYRADQKVYINFSSAGQLIKTSATRPLELGVVSERPLSESQYKLTIKYPDKTYELTTGGTFMRYVRDTKGYVYGVNDDSLWKFDQCGKQVGALIMPKNQTETVTSKTGKSLAIPVTYGEPVIALNGNVYTWKKTALKYSIVKWTWVDDPNVLTGPDAPSGLTVTPSTTGLYLAWKASPNDPGCVTGYEVARATTSGGVFSTVATVEKGVVKYNDATAEVGTQYYYKVRAVAGSEYSQYTTEVSGKR